MSIERGDFEAVSEQDLLDLVAAQVPEGLRLEYKLETYGNNDAAKREFLKDVSALANSQGGHLVLGIEETGGVATAVVGLGDADADAELLRLEQLVRGGLEPRISGLRMKAVPLAGGGHAITLRVPRSWNPPHRVVAQGSNRFYVRHSAGVHEANVDELRNLFTLSGSALDRAQSFRAERLHSIQSETGARPLVGGGRFILHIVPVATFSGQVVVDLEEAHRRYEEFRPIGHAGMSPRFNYHGFINERGGDQNNGYTQIFRNGALEATKAGIVQEKKDGQRYISGAALERHVFDVLSPYIIGLRNLEVPPPLIIMLTFEGVLDANYAVVRNVWNDYEPPLSEDVLFLPECILEDYGEVVDHHKAVRPAFDALWNAIGYSRSQFFNEEGLWVGGGR